MEISDHFSDSLEKSLAESGKSVYAKDRVFWMWFGSRLWGRFFVAETEQNILVFSNTSSQKPGTFTV